jgi:hypothetical protein
VVEAVRADNPSFVTVEADGRDIEVRLSASSASSARTTLEDLLACLRAAERALSEPSADPKVG